MERRSLQNISLKQILSPSVKAVLQSLNNSPLKIAAQSLTPKTPVLSQTILQQGVIEVKVQKRKQHKERKHSCKKPEEPKLLFQIEKQPEAPWVDHQTLQQEMQILYERLRSEMVGLVEERLKAIESRLLDKDQSSHQIQSNFSYNSLFKERPSVGARTIVALTQDSIEQSTMQVKPQLNLAQQSSYRIIGTNESEIIENMLNHSLANQQKKWESNRHSSNDSRPMKPNAVLQNPRESVTKAPFLYSTPAQQLAVHETVSQEDSKSSDSLKSLELVREAGSFDFTHDVKEHHGQKKSIIAPPPTVSQFLKFSSLNKVHKHRRKNQIIANKKIVTRMSVGSTPRKGFSSFIPAVHATLNSSGSQTLFHANESLSIGRIVKVKGMEAKSKRNLALGFQNKRNSEIHFQAEYSSQVSSCLISKRLSPKVFNEPRKSQSRKGWGSSSVEIF